MTAKRISFRERHNNELELQFWLRFFAFVIDYLLLVHVMIPIILMGISVLITLPEPEILPSKNLNNLLGPYGIGLLTIWTYFAVLESSKMQGTIGKWFLRYKVINRGGDRISFSKALIRFPLKVIAIGSIVGVWIIDVNKKRQGLHDMICKTMVKRR